MGRFQTGGVRLEKMLRNGKINRPHLWIDSYNQCTNEICGTIKARIDSNSMYFVSVNLSTARREAIIEAHSKMRK